MAPAKSLADRAARRADAARRATAARRAGIGGSSSETEPEAKDARDDTEEDSEDAAAMFTDSSDDASEPRRKSHPR